MVSAKEFKWKKKVFLEIFKVEKKKTFAEVVQGFAKIERRIDG